MDGPDRADGDGKWPFVSLIVPTYNRRFLLADLLAAVGAQTYPLDRFELILVDDGSPDDTVSLARDLAPAGLSLIVHRQENAGPSAARNTGVGLCRGDLVYFLDDDQRPDADWLQRSVAAFLAMPGRALTGGVFVSSNDPVSWYNLQQSHIFQAGSRHQTAGPTNELIPGNCLMLRTDFLAVGGFDPLRRVAEGQPLSRALAAHGVSLWYEPAMTMAHVVTHRQNAGDFYRYYATVGAGFCQSVQTEKPLVARWLNALRVTFTLPLAPLRAVVVLPDRVKAGFGLRWVLKFAAMDIAGLIGFRVGYWRQWCRGLPPTPEAKR